MTRFSLHCLVIFLAAVGTFMGAGRLGQDVASSAWGAIVMVSLVGAIISYLRYPAEAIGGFVMLTVIPIISVILGHLGSIVIKEPTGLATTVGLMSAVVLVSLAIAENANVLYRWRLAVIALITTGTGLAIEPESLRPAWLTVSVVAAVLFLLAFVVRRQR